MIRLNNYYAVLLYRILSFGGLILVTSLLAVSLAQEDTDTTEYSYDQENAEEINEVCAGCHGEFGEGGSDGEYPRLAGLSAEYLAMELRKFKSRERRSMAMATYSNERELPESDLLDISIYLSKLELYTEMPYLDQNMSSLEKLKVGQRVFNVRPIEGDVVRGERTYIRQCRKCHGATGMGRDETPPLAGQYTEYLRLQIEHFKTGIRKNEKMLKSLRRLTDEQREDLLAYIATLDD